MNDLGKELQENLTNSLLALTGFTMNVLVFTQRVILAPWEFCIFAITVVNGLISELLCFVGRPPKGYISKNKVRELSTVIEHLQLREDNYRQQIRELEGEVERLQRERNVADQRLKQLGEEGEQNKLHLEQLTSSKGGGMTVQFLNPMLHLSSLSVVAMLWWTYMYSYHIWEDRVVWGGCTSVLIVYVLSLSGLLGTWLDAMVHCTAWFTVGLMTSGIILGKSVEAQQQQLVAPS
eukprot:TRINITY_DN2338_c1_g1_i1.p1 TRINITY_DN2338_c1_g1~~TRINITY_DN2338_c1_g1_i1.p1  ORF type:complete len:235 (+),score=27.68 TRINITY_DN2338_c1_g1_i1:205-909(+)